MKVSLIFVALSLAVCGALLGCAPMSDSVLDESQVAPPLIWNEHWQFFRSPEVLGLNDAREANAWQSVTLPHTPKIEPRIVNDQFQGDAWYKKNFTVDHGWENKRAFIDFEGAMHVAEVWVNGEKLAHHKGGYLPFTVDMTEVIRPGENQIMVRLDNRDNPMTGPKPLEILDFSMYGGLYRNVWLRLENALHITDSVAAGEEASGGIFVRYPLVSKERAQISVQTHLRNLEPGAREVNVNHRLFDDAQLVGEISDIVQVAADDTTTSSALIDLNTPRLWSPSEPNLYRLETRVSVDGIVLDAESTRIGIREFKAEPSALYINGEKTFLRGVNRHQEYPYVGYALSDEAQYRDAAKIKAGGFDYVRLSHYPHSKAFMRAADELGLVVIDAILGWQYYLDNPAFEAHIVQTCRDLIRRDRNHASVLAWECSLNESAMPEDFIDRLNAAVHSEYPGENVYSAGWQDYGYDIYLQARQHRLEHYEEPGKPYIVSEYGDWEYYAMNAGLEQDSWGDLLQAERSSRQLLGDGEKRLQQQAANVMEAHDDNFNTPAIADGYWVMFDYNRGYADDLEASGVMSLERLPKFSYHFFQSQRPASEYAGPLAEGYNAFIASYWQADSPLSFHVYSNAEAVELKLNGESLGFGKRDTRYGNLDRAPFYFELEKFVPGELEAFAYAGDQVVSSHKVVTPSAPSRLRLAVDIAGKQPVANDLLFVHAYLEDAFGHNTRITGQAVEFGIEGGELISPVRLNTEAGIASALIKVGAQPKAVVVSAKVVGLEGSAQRTKLH